MRYAEIREAPIADFTVPDDFQGHHYAPADKRLLTKPAHIERIKNVFQRVPVNFNLFFYDTAKDKRPEVQRGEASRQLLMNLGPKVTEYLERIGTQNAITIIMTNNLSDEGQVGMTPWMMAHRIGHALNGDEGYEAFKNARNLFLNFMERMLSNAYNISFDPDKHYNYNVFQEFQEILLHHLSQHLGTMKSATTGNLVNSYEFLYELFAQYLVTGWMTLNHLPQRFDSAHEMTNDPIRLRKLSEIWINFPRRLAKMFDGVLTQAVGKIFVM